MGNTIQQRTYRLGSLMRSWFVIFLCLPTFLFAQKTVKLNLVDLQRQNKLAIINRNVSIGQDGAKQFVKIEKQLQPGQIPGRGEAGVIWLPVDDFSQGSIELVVRGRDILQGSFVGVAFHAVNDSTFDNIYCRPFNFRATDPVRRIHAVQYVYTPKYDWQKLRTEQNGKYEKGIRQPPKAEDWFTLTVFIKGNTVQAFLDHESIPTLVVKKLNQNTTGRVGLTGINYDIESIQIRYQVN